MLDSLFWLTSNLSEMAPLLLAVDDLHWADAASTRFLLYLSARLRDLRVSVQATVRTGEAEDPIAPLLMELAGSGESTTIQVGPLGAGGVASIVEARGIAPEPDLVEAFLEVTGGNPLLLRELLISLEQGSEVATPRTIRSARPEGVAHHVAERMRRLGDDPGALAESLSILGGGTSLPESHGTRSSASATQSLLRTAWRRVD